MSTPANTYSPGSFIVPVLGAVIGSELLFYYTGFDYNLFTDPFSLTGALIDMGVFAALFLVGAVVWQKALQKRQNTTDQQVDQ